MGTCLAEKCANWSEDSCENCGLPWDDYFVAYDDFCGRSATTPDPIDRIQQAMRRRNMTRKDLKQIIGTSASVAEILNRKRKLSLAMIRKIHNRLGVSAEHLISDYELT